ncbi:MAG: histidine phosphatase family protein [Treponema sp.]|nr:histidine phosphatase family protein [Treponema sp.]
MRIVFVRHGDPNYELDCLTPKGKLQAKAAAQRLLREGIEEVWSSIMGRAKETADTFSEASGLPYKTLDFMRELDWGSVDGTPLFADGHPWFCANEMASQGIPLNDPDWENSPYFKNNKVTAIVKNIQQKTDEWLYGLGLERHQHGWRALPGAKQDKTVALFSHGGSSSAAIGRILNIPFPLTCALFHFGHTGITILRFEQEPGVTSVPCIELLNDMSHTSNV